MTGFCSAGHIFSLLAKGTYHPEKLGRKKTVTMMSWSGLLRKVNWYEPHSF